MGCEENKKLLKLNIPTGALRLIISLSAFGGIAVLFRNQLPDVILNLKNVDVPIFLTSLAAFGGVIAFNARRLLLFLHFHHINIPFKLTFYYNLIALFFNTFLPSSLGGEAIKAYCIYNDWGHRKEVFGTVILDRFFGLLCLVALSCTALIISGADGLPTSMRLTIYFMVIITALVALFFLHPRIAGKIDRAQLPLIPHNISQQLKTIYLAMQLFRYNSKIVLTALILSLGAQCFYILNHYLIAQSLGITLPLTFFIFFVPISTILGLAPSVNGLGVREAAYLLYTIEYIAPDKALALSLMTTSTMIIAGCLGGVAYATSGAMGRKPL